MKLKNRYLALSLLAAANAGCWAGAAERAVVEIRPSDGALWLGPDEIRYYECTDGVLLCQGAVGRRSKRLCQCVE